MSYRLSNTSIQNSRLSKTRRPKSKILFFVEGAETEIIYLTQLKKVIDENKNVQIEVFDRFKKLSGESNQLNIVMMTKEYLDTCQGLGKRKINQVEKAIEMLEYGEFSMEEIIATIQDLEARIDDTILTRNDIWKAQLDSIKTCYDYNSELDKLCFVLDRDFESFKEYQYDKVIEICESEGFELGVTTPNFEFYLLLHLQSAFDEITSEEIFRNKNNFAESTLKRIMNESYGEIYKKNKYNAKLFVDKFAAFKENIIHYEQENLKLKNNIGSSLGPIIEHLLS